MFRLIDYRTDRLIAEFPRTLFNSEWGALHSAQHQARRHADGGTPVLLVGGAEPVLYLPPGVTRESLPVLSTPCEVRHYDDPGRRRRRRLELEDQLALPIEREAA